jgi:galactokinase
MAEHEYAGVKCGLMDQISSLFGRKGHLVMSDFRTMAVETVRLGEDVCFLMCNTNAKHSLVESAYNHRREACETAARYFAGVLNRPVHALRDVTWEDWERHRGGMDPLVARRAAHVIGENTRVLKGREMLLAGKVEMFGQLMFESHESSRNYFENSCAELDGVVDAARRIPGVLGARLSGGGFGGSVVILTRPRDVEVISKAISSAYRKDFGHQCDVRLIRASDGARVVHG